MSDTVRKAEAIASASPEAERWDDLPVRWHLGWHARVVAFLFYLPFLDILPFAYIRTDLTSRRHRLGRRAVHHRGLHDHRGRPEHRDRPGRTARPRLRRLLRDRRLLRGAVRVADLTGDRGDPRTGSTSPRAGRWRARPACRSPSPDHDLRRDPRRAHAAPPRRLPRDRDAGLRRDHPDRRAQLGRGTGGPSESTTSRSPRTGGPRTTGPGLLQRARPLPLVLAGTGRPDHLDLGGPPAREQPGRPVLAGDPRGRGRRRDHGRARRSSSSCGRSRSVPPSVASPGCCSPVGRPTSTRATSS